MPENRDCHACTQAVEKSCREHPCSGVRFPGTQFSGDEIARAMPQHETYSLDKRHHGKGHTYRSCSLSAYPADKKGIPQIIERCHKHAHNRRACQRHHQGGYRPVGHFIIMVPVHLKTLVAKLREIQVQLAHNYSEIHSMEARRNKKGLRRNQRSPQTPINYISLCISDDYFLYSCST